MSNDRNAFASYKEIGDGSEIFMVNSFITAKMISYGKGVLQINFELISNFVPRKISFKLIFESNNISSYRN